MGQFGNDTVNHLVGLGVGTTSCNNGDQPFDWFALPDNDHPVIPQNFYRMSGGATNNERFEQIGQSWMKHAFEALEGGFCRPVTRAVALRVPICARVAPILTIQFKCATNWARLTRMGEPIYRLLPIDRQQS